MSENRKSTHTDWIDPDDAPEITDNFFEQADEYHGDRLIRRGRPKVQITKKHTTIRLSQDVLDRFRATGPGWQTRIDEALKEWLQTHERA